MKKVSVFDLLIKKIAKNIIKVLSLCAIFIIVAVLLFNSFRPAYAVSNNNHDLFFPNTSNITAPTDLLVIIFLYDDYPYQNNLINRISNMNDNNIKDKYYNEIFGTGTIDNQTWSINDYYKEISNELFYFNPVVIDNNDSGIYPVRFNKSYNQSDFSSDIKEGFQRLIAKGLDTTDYGMRYNHTSKKKILCVFPTIDIEHVGGYYISNNQVADMAITTYSSTLAVTAHELGHTLELPDLYNQLGLNDSLMGPIFYNSDIEDLRYPGKSYSIPQHMDPLHKISLGWHDYEIIDTDTTVKLYPTTSPMYKPYIITTNNDNQYYIIENKKKEQFESAISKEGIYIWHIDQAGYSKLHLNSYRKGNYILNVLSNQNEFTFPMMYSNNEDAADDTKVNTNIKITYKQMNEDGSISADISFDNKYLNSYTIRFHANDGTNNYIDKTYSYTEQVVLTNQLFFRTDYTILSWNSNPDGSGQNYVGEYLGYGLIDENNGIVNLYAQWKKEKYIISFDANGGTGIMESVTIDKDVFDNGYVLPNVEFVGPSTAPIFKGWYVPGYDSIMQIGEKVFLNDDTILIAQWGLNESPNSNTVTIEFNTNGGSSINDQQIIKGSSVIEPSSPSKDGYFFNGWYLDETYKNKYYFGGPVYSNMTLYAKWIPNENVISTVVLNMEIPSVGEKVSIQTEKFEDMEYWNWNTQTPQMSIVISDDEKYHLLDNNGDSNYMNWITEDSFEYVLEPITLEPYIGAFEYDTKYYAQLRLKTDEDNIFSNDVEVTINGEKVNKVLADNDRLIIGVTLKTPKEKEDGKYTITYGNNMHYSNNSETDLIIKANGNISDFEYLKVDDNILESDNYTVYSGSTIVILKKEYLNTLLNGTHKVTLVYKDGEISTTLTINNTQNKNSEEIIKDTSSMTEPSTSADKNKKKNPSTGDNIIVAILGLIFSMFGVIISYKKINHKII